MKRVTQNTAHIPIYQQLVDQYKQAILTQKLLPGTKIDSINEIQLRHKVSRETAKIVLKKLSAEGLIIQRPGKGSFISELGPRKKVWGVIVPFFSAQIEQLIHQLRFEVVQLGRKLEHFVDYNNWEEEIKLVGTMINERYEAVIVIPTFDESKTSPFYKRLQTGRTVVTLLDHTMTGSSFTYVIQSYDLGVRRAVKYLLEKSSGTIAFVKNNIWLGRNMVQEVMEETFKHFLQKDSHRKYCIIEDVNFINKEFIEENGIKGLFCCDDTDAIRVVGRLKEWDFQFSEHIALVSYGNTDLARYFTPAITSIDPHYTEMAAISTEIIRNHIKGIDVSLRQHVLQPELIIRDT